MPKKPMIDLADLNCPNCFLPYTYIRHRARRDQYYCIICGYFFADPATRADVDSYKASLIDKNADAV